MTAVLTNQELENIEIVWSSARHPEPTPTVLRLVAEVRRLRSDGWLEKALAEMFNTMQPGYGPGWPKVWLTILQKHRDEAEGK